MLWLASVLRRDAQMESGEKFLPTGFSTWE